MSTRDSVLDALRDAGGSGVSGESLAASLGVSRAAIAKHISSLRSNGYVIEGAAGKGYVLLDCPDRLLKAEIMKHLSSGFWTRIEAVAETASTNDDCKNLAREGAAEGTVCVAERQSLGRGRLGRTWVSPEGGVYMSILLRPTMELASLSTLPLVVAIAVARAVEKLGVNRASVKWPNDVWIGEEKLAGILLEASTGGEAVEWIVVGIGLNACIPAQPHVGAVYLEQCCEIDSRAQVAAAVLDQIAEVYPRFGAAGFEAFAAEYSDRSVLQGRHVVARGIDGAKRGEGTVVGVDEIGRLLLDSGDEQIAVAAGDVTLRDQA